MPEKNPQPDWAYWSAMHDVELWEAVLLSLNVDPRVIRQMYSSDSRMFYLSKYKGFRDRIELSKNNVSRKLHVKSPFFSNEYTRVLLTDFAQFANDVGMTLPDEFPTEPLNTAPALMPDYLPPYLEFMLRAASQLGLSPNDNHRKKDIEYWLMDNWPTEFGNAKKTDGTPSNKVENMATFLRRPDQERGGAAKAEKKA